MFMIRWKNIKIPQWVIHLLLVLNMGFYVMIATVDYHHLYYKDYWLAPSKANLNGYTLGSCGGPVFGVGTSMTFRANYNFDLRFQTTYYLQPPMVRESRQHLNTLTLGLSANIAF